MFQFAGLPPAPYGFRYGYRRITSGEFPHSEIPGSQDGQLLPRAYRSRPRPSSALGAKASTVCPCSLDQEEHRYRCRYGVFKVRADRHPVLQNSTACDAEVDVRSRRAGRPDGRSHRRDRRLPECKSSGIPRKEVIQPQLPLRLPCYDFTPIIDPTFDGSLPCGLGHRLRVLPTFVV